MALKWGLQTKRLKRKFKGEKVTQKHFNRSLSHPPMQKNRCSGIVKWRTRVTIKLLMYNGGGKKFTSAEAIVIRRVDVLKVHDYARAHAGLRDYLIIRLPLKIGLRTGEICSLKIERINFEQRDFEVLDSKKHRFYPLPLDPVTLQLIKDLVAGRSEGFVFRQEKAWTQKRAEKPLTLQAVWWIVHHTAEKAGVKNFNPRWLRHYFAANWLAEMKQPDSKKTMEGLRRILRHKNLTATQVYLSRLTFFEDLKDEYQQTQHPYVDRPQQNAPRMVSSFYREWCSKCDREPTCKFIDQMCSCQACSGCRFYKPKKELII